MRSRMLYDHGIDPDETVYLVEDADYTEVVKMLQDKLSAFIANRDKSHGALSN